MNEPKGYFSGFDEIPLEIKPKLWGEGLPFYLAHDQKPETIVVCLHGYTATPYEAKPIGKACFELGMDAVGPLMPGHGYKDVSDQKKHLSAEMKVDNMLNAVRMEVQRARDHYNKVFLFGQSMGGVLTLIIAGEGLVDACATTAPAIKLPFGSGLARYLLGWTDIYLADQGQAEDRDFINYSYPFVGAQSGKELHKLSMMARKKLKNITCPVLECHSHNDGTIDPVVANWIENNVSGPVQVNWYDESDHTMPLDVQGEEISQDIAKFFDKLRK